MEGEAQEAYELRQLEYKTYLDERKVLLEGAKEGSRSFDKAIMTLSAGALALSFTFIGNNIAELTNFEKGILIASWVMLGFSLILIIISFQTSLHAHQHKIDLLGLKLVLNDEPQKDVAEVKNLEKKCNSLDRATGNLCIFSGSAFAVGVTLLAVFLISILP